MDTAMMTGKREKMASALRGRILNALPAASYQMDRFLKLVDVVVSDQTESACVEVGPQPRLHLNETFVQKHCQRDEHLLMLILHELYHIILGHTRLFHRLSFAHNIVFDAFINAMLCHQFREPVFLEFFENLNSDTDFPSRLLRPPTGWDNEPMQYPVDARDNEKAVMTRLYGSDWRTVTYQEIYDLLKVSLKDEDASLCTLLGDHDGSDAMGEKDQTAVNDALFKNILGRVVVDWPQKTNWSQGQGSHVFDYILPKPRSPKTDFLAALKRFLNKARVLQPDRRTPYSWQKTDYHIETMMALPNWRDRHAHSKEVLMGTAPILNKSELEVRRVHWTQRQMSHVYIDISGSMEEILPWLAGAMRCIEKQGSCRLYAFSTVVNEIRQGQLLKGKLQNTGGTDINCVYEHVANLPIRNIPRKVVVLTDGYTGLPTTNLQLEWKRRKVELFVGLVGNCPSVQLQTLAKRIERLPKFQ